MLTIKRHSIETLALHSYTVTSQQEMLVVDPLWDYEIYLQQAKETQTQIVGIIVTHLHTDFICGFMALAHRLNIPIYLGYNLSETEEVLGVPEHSMQIMVQDGLVIKWGDVVGKFWLTPGHSMGDLSLLVYDDDKMNWDGVRAIFTGDLLFNGEVGRPEPLLLPGIEENIAASYASIKRLTELPGSVQIYVCHGKGVLAPAGVSKKLETTIEEQNSMNPFFSYSLQDYQLKIKNDPRPLIQTSAMIIKKNQDGRIWDDHANHENLDPTMITLDSFVGMVKGNTYQMLDARFGEDFAQGFVAGFVNMDLDSKVELWSQIIFSPSQPILVICDPGDEIEVLNRLSSVGLDNVAGFLAGGFTSWEEAGLPIKSYRRVEVKKAYALLNGERAPTLIDIRPQYEIQMEGAIAQHQEVDFLTFYNQMEIGIPDKKKEILLLCANGHRTATLASMLCNLGYTNVADIKGGINAWKYNQLPLIG